jgi:ABC-type sugar transport system permease subunit
VSRAREALGAAVGALLVSGLVAAVASTLYLRTVNSGEGALAQLPAAASGRALASLAQRSLAQGDDVALQAAVVELKKKEPTIRVAVVVAEPKSVKYRFLRKRRYLASDDPRRAGQTLDPQNAGDKAVYDLAAQVRQQGEQVTSLTRPGAPLRIEAAFPVQVNGKHQAMALVLTEPTGGGALVPAWPIAAGVVALALLGLFAGATLGRRPRYLAIIAGAVGASLLCSLLLSRVHAAYAARLDELARQLSAQLPLDAAALDGFRHALPSGGCWALALAAIGAAGIGLLGLLGYGARLAATLRQHRFAYAYVLPAGLGMIVLVFVPFGYGIGLGFFDHAHGHYTFVGLRNFAEILSGGGRPITHPLNFYFTLGVTVLWTAVNVLLHTGIGLGLALLLKDPLLRFKGVYRVLLVLPWAVPNYITALIWKGMFHQQYGAVNHLLESIGLHKVSWFSSFSTAFTANLTTNTWLGFPFMMVVSLGALQSIPKDVYEAASVDGASPWQTFRRITLPLLRPALFPAIILGSIWTFNMFNIIYLVSSGEPGGATDILITEAYRWAFERADRYGLAAAYATLIFIILLIYTLITNRVARATEDVLE